MPDIDIDNRWFPPSPHKERVVELLEKGRAHLEAQGHGRAPLLIFEDGGQMELPHFRWADGDAVAERGADLSRSTRYSDVCGTIEELKRLLQDDPAIVARDPAVVERLLDEGLMMIDRMYRRLSEYRDFQSALGVRWGQMEGLSAPDRRPAAEGAEAIRSAIQRGPDMVRSDLEELHRRAEEVREVASALESRLYAFRDLCIEIGELYEGIRGARKWGS